ncbi:MAG: hypothetical protein CL493_03105 [Actinobacteria bacterium]|nr:hypothetical protein [Actinomycetota bacterium]
MEYNFLILQDRRLFYKEKNKLSSLNKDSLEVLVKKHTLISNTFIQEGSLKSEILNLLENNEVVVNFEKVSSALKEIENNQIISHLKRENFRKISFPIITKSDFLKKYLIDNLFLFTIDAFLNTSNFQGVELDSWYQ